MTQVFQRWFFDCDGSSDRFAAILEWGHRVNVGNYVMRFAHCFAS